MLAIDTNLIVRYLTGDDPDQASRARAVIDGGEVFVPLTVVLEVEWVLRSAYDFRAPEVIRALRAFAGLPRVSLEEPDLVAGALDLIALGLDFADALHLRRSSHCEGFVTFDRTLVKVARDIGNATVGEA